MELVNFIAQDEWHFVGTLVFIWLTCEAIAQIVAAARK